ncbi:MAG: hypothetical protein ACPGVD_09235, partial [Flavobacteriales bacterium]
LKDQSYRVIGVCLQSMAKDNPKKAMKIANGLENEKSKDVKSIIAGLYSEHGDKSNHEFFVQAINESSGFSKYGLLNKYTVYLNKLEANELSPSYPVYEGVVNNSSAWWMKMVGYQGLIANKNRIKNRIGELETDLSVESEVTKKSIIERKISELKAELSSVDKMYNSLLKTEKDEKVKGYLNNM